MFVIICVIIGLLTLFYLYCKYKFTYWEKLGVPYLTPSIPWGNFKEWNSVHTAQVLQKFYTHFKGKHTFCGVFLLLEPIALLIDLDMVKHILIKDFDVFHDRGIYYNEKDDPLSAHLISIKHDKWRQLRAKLTPTFTSRRLKDMTPIIVKIGEELQNTLDLTLSTRQEVEFKEIMARFTTDIIGTCAFGIDCNSLKDPNAEFRLMGKKAFDYFRQIGIKLMVAVNFPKVALFFKVKITPDDVHDFFMKVVKETIAFREKNNVHRNDFMDLLIQLKNTGKLDEDETKTSLGNLTIEEIAAQCYIFFLAGFETSSTTLSYCLFELARNQDVQDKARGFIHEVLSPHGNKLTYEAIMEMTYLDQIINETFRKYPPVSEIFRIADQDYPIPGTNVILEKGRLATVPVYAIQNDPDIYPNPDVFDPERFTAEAIRNRHPQAFLPFGDGPRNCIGYRFGMLQIRIAIISLLKHFRFKPSSKTKTVEFLPKSIVLASKNDMWLKVEKI